MLKLTHEQVVAFRLAREWINQIQWTIDKNGVSVWYCEPSYRNDIGAWIEKVHPEYIHLVLLANKCAKAIWPVAYDNDEDQYVFIESIDTKNIQYYSDIADKIPHFSV